MIDNKEKEYREMYNELKALSLKKYYHVVRCFMCKLIIQDQKLLFTNQSKIKEEL